MFVILYALCIKYVYRGSFEDGKEDKVMRPMCCFCSPKMNLLCNSIFRRKNLAWALGLAALT